MIAPRPPVPLAAGTEQRPLSIAATGFVAAEAGSVASANALLLEQLLLFGHQVTFFCKPGFVDPRTAISKKAADNLTVVDCTNHHVTALQQAIARNQATAWGAAWGRLNAYTYNRAICAAMRSHSAADVDLWLGDWARGRGSRPVVSFPQGPPGTDARSIKKHKRDIVELAGWRTYWKLQAFSAYRLSLGLPAFKFSDHIVMPSVWSKHCMSQSFSTPEKQLHVCPYPIALDSFTALAQKPASGPLRVVWLGRIVPRKRLDLFLNGLELAIRQGLHVEAIIVGRSSFVAGYERMIERFPYPECVAWKPYVPRTSVPDLFATTDVLAQPSDEENFGSSVAEALACGVPVIVGATNGTGDYICSRSIRLVDDAPETFANALRHFAQLKRSGELANGTPSRRTAEEMFDPGRVAKLLERILYQAVA